MNELSVETLQLIQKTAVEAAGAGSKFVIENAEVIGEDYYAIGKADGTVEIRQKPRRDRDHVLAFISEVVPYCQYATEKLGATPSIWFNGRRLEIMLRDTEIKGTFGDRATLSLAVTEQIETLLALEESPRKFTQKDFVKLLRLQFASALGTKADQIIAACRSISFSESQRGSSTIGNGRQSLGRELEAEIRSEAGPIPETIELTLPYYEDPDLQFPVVIRCDLEVNSSDQSFVLTPLSGELRRAIHALSRQVVEIVSKSGCPVFLGAH